ncbi:MAG: response regulator [Desulfohalobiaceae bacterium]|nr:response regulator [Desulfohalobiaceae bacterium]
MGKSVLIVDDSKTMRKIITKTLRQTGYEVDSITEAEDGQQGLDHLQKEKPDLILCDINMPNMDGIEFLKQLSSDGSLKNIPVLMITTEGGSDDVVQQVRDLGAAGSLGKPFTADKLQELLEGVL